MMITETYTTGLKGAAMTETEYKVLSDGRRLDVLLSEATGLSRSRVASLMEDGLCVSGGKECRKAGLKLPAGQEIILTVPAPKEAVPKAENIPLEILYEDEDLAVVIKPRGFPGRNRRRTAPRDCAPAGQGNQRPDAGGEER